ncbi:hypothetical protein HYC85_025542 [Camellia sinensis]|uniref:Uncharacterized protein n=1 Tax=Camellia sinensis TaxID=4442 RepID=A0A7J7GFB1_CAMSI|nr:hypothetical protein HYC85_025542 [Camellia sinensis]
MSPYEDRYVDVKFVDKIAGYVTVTIDKEFQRLHLFCLAFGVVLLLLAPVVSSWVPFYCSSSMAVGVFLVIIILLFQGMKLLPTGRENVFYLTLYGSVLEAGSFLLHHFSMLVNSILFSFGLSEEMRNPFAFAGVLESSYSVKFADFEFDWSCNFSVALRSDLQDEIWSGFGPSTPVRRLSQLFVNQLPWTPCTMSILHLWFEAVSRLRQSIASCNSTLYNELMLGVVNSSSFEVATADYQTNQLKDLIS